MTESNVGTLGGGHALILCSFTHAKRRSVYRGRRRLRESDSVAKARKAALNNDQAKLEQELTEAATVWPGNPEFKEVFAQLNKQGDVVQTALLEFDQLLSQEVKAAERYRSPICLLLGDVDHFKAVNDRFGHPVGDALLKQLAALLTESAL